ATLERARRRGGTDAPAVDGALWTTGRTCPAWSPGAVDRSAGPLRSALLRKRTGASDPSPPPCARLPAGLGPAPTRGEARPRRAPAHLPAYPGPRSRDRTAARPPTPRHRPPPPAARR